MAKKIFQFSKIITLVLIVMNIVTWIRGMKLYWNELDHFNYMLEFTKSLSEVVLPYFCLSMTDRMVYIAQYVKDYFENEKNKTTKRASKTTSKATKASKGERK